jgi:hypothetical protein
MHALMDPAGGAQRAPDLFTTPGTRVRFPLKFREKYGSIRDMEVVVTSDARAFIQALSEWKPDDDPRAAAEEFAIDEPTRIPGIAESWFEIVAAIGIPGIPIGLASNLVASWIWSSLQKTETRTRRVRVIVRDQTREVQIEVGETAETLQAIVQSAIERVHTGS